MIVLYQKEGILLFYLKQESVASSERRFIIRQL